MKHIKLIVILGSIFFCQSYDNYVMQGWCPMSIEIARIERRIFVYRHISPNRYVWISEGIK